MKKLFISKPMKGLTDKENKRPVAVNCKKCGCPLFKDEIMCPDCLAPRYEE